MPVAGRGTDNQDKMGIQMYRDLIDNDINSYAMLLYYGDGIAKGRNEATRLLVSARDLSVSGDSI
jgi:hypothetical protein